MENLPWFLLWFFHFNVGVKFAILFHSATFLLRCNVLLCLLTDRTTLILCLRAHQCALINPISEEILSCLHNFVTFHWNRFKFSFSYQFFIIALFSSIFLSLLFCSSFFFSFSSTKWKQTSTNDYKIFFFFCFCKWVHRRTMDLEYLISFLLMGAH